MALVPFSGLASYVRFSLLTVVVLAPRGFTPATPAFPSPQNPTSKFHLNTVDEEPPRGCATTNFHLSYYILNEIASFDGIAQVSPPPILPV